MLGWSVLYYMLSLLELLIVVRVILSWVAPGSRNEAVLLVRSVTDLFLEPIRSFLPRTGAIDFSPMVAFLIISLLQSFVTRMMW